MTWNNIFKKFGMTYLYTNIFYILDWRKPKSSSVNEFLKEQVLISMQLLQEEKLPSFAGTQDDVMIKILEWVHDNFTYEKDSVRFKVAEKWQTVTETLDFKRGDCEDGAILIYCLAWVNGVNPAQLKLVTGDVIGGGHCWVEYLSDEFFNDDFWYPIDWCYYYTPNIFKYRKDITNHSKYKKKWWELSIVEL